MCGRSPKWQWSDCVFSLCSKCAEYATHCIILKQRPCIKTTLTLKTRNVCWYFCLILSIVCMKDVSDDSYISVFSQKLLGKNNFKKFRDNFVIKINAIHWVQCFGVYRAHCNLKNLKIFNYKFYFVMYILVRQLVIRDANKGNIQCLRLNLIRYIII
jgi:hypothetical protein